MYFWLIHLDLYAVLHKWLVNYTPVWFWKCILFLNNSRNYFLKSFKRPFPEPSSSDLRFHKVYTTGKMAQCMALRPGCILLSTFYISTNFTFNTGRHGLLVKNRCLASKLYEIFYELSRISGIKVWSKF